LLGTLACGLVNSYLTLVAARVATGAFGGIIGGLALAIIGDVFPESKRGAATGALMSAFAVASVVGVPFGLYLGNNLFDWHAPFLVLAGLGVFVLVGALWAFPSLRGHLRAPGHTDGPFAEMRATLVDPNHLRAFTLVVSLMFGGFLVIPYISPYLVANVGVAERSLPIVYVSSGALTLFVAPLIGKISDRVGKLRVYRAVAPLAATLMFVVTNLPPVHLALAIAVVAALMVGNAGRMVVAMAMVTASADPRRRGSFMSLNSAVQHFSSGLGAFVAGAIIERAPDGALLHYRIVGFLAVASTLLSLYLAGRLRVAKAVFPARVGVVAE
jgi:predicted MFS family arabinose efflux permease